MAKVAKTMLALLLAVVLLLATISPASAEMIDLNPANFDKIVKDPSKNVFVLFYAPWCGHCNRMKPEWNNLAQDFPVSGTTLIARINADEHKKIAAKYNVNGFPTIIFFSKNDKNGVQYDGDRSVKAFKKYITEHAK